MPQSNPNAALVLIVMGVSGCGKSTVADRLAQRLGWVFADGDDFHSAQNKARQNAGQALTDADRWPWLDSIAAWIGERLAAGEGGVVVCSALKRVYRDLLVQGRTNVRIVYLEGSRELIAGRLAQRRDHFMSPTLLDNQFATLEPPGEDEDPIVVGVEEEPEAIVTTIVTRLGFPQRV